MPAARPLSAHLTEAEIRTRYLVGSGGLEQIRWHAVLLKCQGYAHQDIAQITQRKRKWVGQIIRRYSAGGPESLRDLRQDNGGELRLTDDQQDQLWQAIQQPPPDRGVWTGPKVVRWVKDRFNTSISDTTACRYLRRLHFSRQLPRPGHVQADQEAREVVKRGDLSGQ